MPVLGDGVSWDETAHSNEEATIVIYDMRREREREREREIPKLRNAAKKRSIRGL